MSATLQDAGMRYVIRSTPEGVTGRWSYPEFIEAGEVDCTDMDDEQFERAVRDMEVLAQAHRKAEARKYSAEPVRITAMGEL